MPFKVTDYDGNTETIDAAVFVDIEQGDWIEFRDGSGNQMVRIRSGNIKRIDAVQSEG